MKVARPIASFRKSVQRRRRAWYGPAHSRVFTMLAAIRPGHAAALSDTLRSFPVDANSPLATVPHVHVARWVVIDQLKTDWAGAPRRIQRLNSAYLLFSATLAIPRDSDDRFPQTFVDDIRTKMGGAADKVWGHCMGYPGTLGHDDFIDYFLSCRVRTGIHQFGYPDVTVDAVRRALTTRRQFTEFALAHQDESGEALKNAYVQESAKWSS